MTGPQHIGPGEGFEPSGGGIPRGSSDPGRGPLLPPTSCGSPFNHSGNPDAGHCSPEVAYRRATACGSGTCVEVAQVDAAVLVRDSKHPDVVLRFTVAEWRAFVDGVKAGGFDW